MRPSHLAAACALMLGAALSGQRSIRILRVDKSRVFACGSSFAFDSTGVFKAAHAAVTNTQNFGPSGKVGRKIELLPRASLITTDALTKADVVLLTILQPNKRLSRDELTALASFVNAGGGLMIFSTNAALLYSDLLGAVGGGFAGAQNVTVETASAGMTKGPFGTIAKGTKIAAGGSGSFVTLQAGATGVLKRGTAWVAAEFAIGKGKAAVFNDEEIFASAAANCSKSGWTSTTQTLFLNSIAHVAPPTTFAYSKAQEVFALYGKGCAGSAGAPTIMYFGEPTGGKQLRIVIYSGPKGAPALVILGTGRTSLPILDCTAHVFPVVLTFNWILSNDPLRPGSAVLPFTVPNGVKGKLTVMAGALDLAHSRNFVFTNGAEATLR